MVFILPFFLIMPAQKDFLFIYILIINQVAVCFPLKIPVNDIFIKKLPLPAL